MSAAPQTLSGGFSNAATDAAHAFRAVMTVMARPGEIRCLDQAKPPAPLSSAAGTLILTLCDPETRLHLAGAFDSEDIRNWVTFHTGAPFSGPAEADFAVGRWSDLAPLSQYPVGSPEYPDRSATLIVECDSLSATGAALKGPGIRDSARLPLPDIAAFAENHSLYPLGLDFFFTAGADVAGMPRSTEITEN